MESFVYFLFWIGMCALFALAGRNRKIGYGWSFLLCLFVSPLIGLIITLFSKKKQVDFLDMSEESKKNEIK